jgi:hypothetical protein
MKRLKKTQVKATHPHTAHPSQFPNRFPFIVVDVVVGETFFFWSVTTIPSGEEEGDDDDGEADGGAVFSLLSLVVVVDISFSLFLSFSS